MAVGNNVEIVYAGSNGYENLELEREKIHQEEEPALFQVSIGKIKAVSTNGHEDDGLIEDLDGELEDYDPTLELSRL